MSKIKKIDNKWGLNTEQRNFCDYYLQSRNLRYSYKKAYAEPKGVFMNNNTASVNANKLMKRENVQQYLKDREEVLGLEHTMNEDEILLEINKMALDTSNSPTNRLKAFELLGKKKGMWIDRTETSGEMDFEFNLTGFDLGELKKVESAVVEADKVENNEVDISKVFEAIGKLESEIEKSDFID